MKPNPDLLRGLFTFHVWVHTLTRTYLMQEPVTVAGIDLVTIVRSIKERKERESAR